jgi:hypothetical protein
VDEDEQDVRRTRRPTRSRVERIDEPRRDTTGLTARAMKLHQPFSGSPSSAAWVSASFSSVSDGSYC